MGFTPSQETKRTKKYCVDWEKQENSEIKQNSSGFYKKKYSKIKQRFYYKPEKAKEILKRDTRKDFNITTEEVLNTLIWEQGEQEEFVDKLKNVKGNLENLENKINEDIESLQKPFKNELKYNKTIMEKKKKEKILDNKESTWAESLAENRNLKDSKEISKERFSLKHQCVCTSPRYYSDKNLCLRPKMRSVASQIGAEIELLDQGAVGDHNSLKDIQSLEAIKGKGVYKDLRSEAIVNCCYGLINQTQGLQYNTGTVPCPHCNCQQRDLTTKREYNYCGEEYYYNLNNCNCLKNCTNCYQERDYRRQSTDLNTQHFFNQSKDKTSSPERIIKKSKRKPDNKTNTYKSKESYEEYNERKKRECEERLNKLKEKTNKKYSSKKVDSQKLKQLLKEENAKKLIKYLDQYVEDHAKELREDLKNLQTKEQETSSNTHNSMNNIERQEKYCQVKIREHKKQTEIKVTKSLETQYSWATLKMLKKMTIREYKPRNSVEKQNAKTHSLVNSDVNKQYLEKIKNYHDYQEKYEKEMKINKSLETLKSPLEFFPPQESETNEIFDKIRENFMHSSKAQNQANKALLKEDIARANQSDNKEIGNISQDSLQSQRESVDNRELNLTSRELQREQIQILRSQNQRAKPRNNKLKANISQDSLPSETISTNNNREDILSPREQIQILREQIQRAQTRDNKKRTIISQDSLQSTTISTNNNREDISSPREQIQILREQIQRAQPTDNKVRANITKDFSQTPINNREQLREYERSSKVSQSSLRATRIKQNGKKALNNKESFEEFRYEYGPKSRTMKTWDDYRESDNLEDQNYKPPLKEAREVQYEEMKRKPKENKQLFKKHLKETESYEDFPYEFKERTIEEDQDIVKQTRDIYSNDNTREMTKQGRLNGNKDRIPRDFSTMYEDKRRELLERNEYKLGQLSKKEYYEINVEQKTIREFKDKEENLKQRRSENDKGKTIESLDKRTAQKSDISKRDFKDESLSLREHLKNARENIDKDFKQLSSEYDKEKLKEDHISKRAIRDERQLINNSLNQRENLRESRESDATADEFNRKYSKDKSQHYEKNQRPKYYKDERDFLGQRHETRETKSNCYEEQKEDQNFNYYGNKREEETTYQRDKRNKFIEEMQPATDNERFSYYGDNRREFVDDQQVKAKCYKDKRTLPLIEQSGSKYYTDRQEEFRKEIQPPTEDRRYYKIGDQMKIKRRNSSEEIYKQKNSEINDEKYSLDTRQNTLDENQKEIKNQSPQYLKNEKQNSKHYGDFRRDSLEAINEHNWRDMRDEKYTLNGQEKTKYSKDESQIAIDHQKSKYFKHESIDSLDVKQAQNIDMDYEFHKSSRHSDNEPEIEAMPRKNLNQKIVDHLKYEMKSSPKWSTNNDEQQEVPDKESPEYRLQKETENHQNLIAENFPLQTEFQNKETPQHLLKKDADKFDEKSQTSSYKDFKQVMDHNLGFYTNRESQTDYNFKQEINIQNSIQTFNKETSIEEFKAVSTTIPASTEEALDFLKNLIETSPQLGLKNECLNSVTLAAKDLITKLSSCQSSLKIETLTNVNERKSSEDCKNYNLEEKSTVETQYKDLETTTDSSENQLAKPVKQNEIGINEGVQQPDDLNFIQETTNSFETQINPQYCEIPESGELNFLQQEFYHYQTQINAPYHESSETYQSCLKSKDSLVCLIPPQEFMDPVETLNPNQYESVPIYDENTLIHQIESLEPCFSLNDCKYIPLPSPRRQTAFDPDLQPLKGILKPCREMESHSCDLITQRTTSVVNFDQRDEINIETESTMICQQNQEEIAQQFNENQEMIITKDETFKPIEKHTKHKVSKHTSIKHPISKECRQSLETNLIAFNGNNLYNSGIPAFKQCPCMLPTYTKMLKNYYKEKKK